MASTTDIGLAERIRQRRPGAVEAILRRHGSELLALAYLIHPRLADAERALIAGVAEAWRRAEEAPSEGLGGWLAASIAAATLARASSAIDEPSRRPHSPVLDALAELDPRTRAAAVVHAVFGSDPAAIGVLLEETEQAVKQRLATVDAAVARHLYDADARDDEGVRRAIREAARAVPFAMDPRVIESSVVGRTVWQNESGPTDSSLWPAAVTVAASAAIALVFILFDPIGQFVTPAPSASAIAVGPTPHASIELPPASIARTPAPTPHPADRADTAWVAVDDRLYLFGGSIDGVPVAANAVFDLRSWRDLPALPFPRSGGSAVYVPDEGIYVLGGEDASGEPVDSVLVFEMSSGTWLERPAMPDPAHMPAAALAGDAIYVFGGVGPDDLATVQVFDLRSQTWASGPPMPVPLADAAAVTLNEIMYLFGGSTPDGELSAAALRFDPAAGSWTRLPDMPGAGTGLSAVIIDTEIWVIGVSGGDDSRWTTPLRFEPSAADWTMLPEQHGAPGSTRPGHAAIALSSGQIMVIGGGVPLLIETRLP